MAQPSHDLTTVVACLLVGRGRPVVLEEGRPLSAPRLAPLRSDVSQLSNPPAEVALTRADARCLRNRTVFRLLYRKWTPKRYWQVNFVASHSLLKMIKPLIKMRQILSRISPRDGSD